MLVEARISMPVCFYSRIPVVIVSSWKEYSLCFFPLVRPIARNGVNSFLFCDASLAAAATFLWVFMERFL